MTAFTRTRQALAADRFRPLALALAIAVLLLAGWGAWSVTARLAPRAGAPAPAADRSPAALTLRAAGAGRR